MGEKRVFDKAFKERAVELARTTDRKQSEIATELGITGNILARWKRDARQAEGGSPGRRTGPTSERSGGSS